MDLVTVLGRAVAALVLAISLLLFVGLVLYVLPWVLSWVGYHLRRKK
jgi:hypothetical protein